MADFPLVVSYYTKDTLYQLEVQNLIASCEMWGLKHWIEPIASAGSWEYNCAYKPFFLYQMLQKHQCPLFWVDADGVFAKKPEVLEVFSNDLAVLINDLPDDHPSKVYSASVYVNATEPAERILKLWAKECCDQLADPHRTEEVWDQIALRNVLHKGEASVGKLPIEYAAIFDQGEAEHAVITHYQASRRLKKSINAH
ncbi:MAG: hypothetical protein JSS61_01420 [Verrucomicrobia bacterium]|nr:hypothetical protein [Verrucomicrobiota bacterium]